MPDDDGQHERWFAEMHERQRWAEQKVSKLERELQPNLNVWREILEKIDEGNGTGIRPEPER